MENPETESTHDHDDRSWTGITIDLKPQWDSALSYQLLEHQREPEPEDAPIFVGRDELVNQLANAVGRPQRRGTVLVSGYRGAGKTSLVIEAARRGRKLLPDGWRLLPLILNVSEVSAALDRGTSEENKPPDIDARRLLTGLLLTLQRKQKDGLIKKNVADIDSAYQKAVASRYTVTEQRGREDILGRTVESTRRFEVADLWKLVAMVAGIAAVGLEGLALRGAAAAVHVLAGALVGAVILSYARSVYVSRKTTQTETQHVELVRDNSLSHLENDLKSILFQLHSDKLRSVIILDELDKIDDKEGKQLDSVIRYFKNLFTQAPALFFFLTDKQYYDLIQMRIDDARRQGFYALEHTFFTHRVFVGRPSAVSCVEYLSAAAANEKDLAAILSILDADANRVRDVDKEMEPLEQFVRLLLFRAENHFFDLKHEMRRLVRTSVERTALVLDKDSPIEAELRLAAFQFLIEQSVRVSAMTGREYANEILRDCLYSVFRGLGTAENQPILSFYPNADKQRLDQAEEQRIKAAVLGLVGDLKAGGAITVNTDEDSFVWNPRAATVFVPQPRLKSHEMELAHALTTLGRLAERFGGNGDLAGLAGDVTEVRAEQLKSQAKDITNARQVLPTDEADRQLAPVRKTIYNILNRSYERNRKRLEQSGLVFREIGIVPAGGVWRLDAPGSALGVFLVYGTANEQAAEVEKIALSEELGRIAVIHVELAVEATVKGANQPSDSGNLWIGLGQRIGLTDDCYLLTSVPLSESLRPAQFEKMWGQKTLDELVFAKVWVTSAKRLDLGPLVLLKVDGKAYPEAAKTEATSSTHLYTSFDEAMGVWFESGDTGLLVAIDAINETPRVFYNAKRRPICLLPESQMINEETESTRRLADSSRLIWFLDRYGDPRGGTRRVAPVDNADVLRGMHRVGALTQADDVYSSTQLGTALRQTDLGDGEAWYRRASDAGNSEAAVLLAGVLQERAGTDDTGEREAKLLYEKAAKANHPVAMRELSRLLKETEPDRAQDLLRKAAEHSDTAALIDCSLAEESGDSLKFQELLVKQGRDDAIKHVHSRLKPDAATDFARLVARVGESSVISTFGQGLEKGQRESFYRVAAEAGDAESMFQLARILKPDGPLDGESKQWLLKAAEAGSLDAMIRLARDLDAEAAKPWVAQVSKRVGYWAIKSTADQLGDRAEQFYAELISSGDLEKIRAAANAGHSGSMVALADSLRAKKPKEARTWYRKAVEAGDGTAKQRLDELEATADRSAATEQEGGEDEEKKRKSS